MPKFKIIQYKRKINYLRHFYHRRSFNAAVYSYGGGGTRLLHTYMSKYFPVNHPATVHYGREVDATPSVSIYIFGIPHKAVMSFYRRGKNDNGKFLKNHAMNMDSLEPVPPTISGYAELGKDAFLLERHFRYFYDVYSKYHPIVFIRYEKMWDNLELIFRHLGLEGEEKSFPVKRKRKGSIGVDRRLEVKLEQIHDSLFKTQGNLPDIFLRYEEKNRDLI